MENTGIPFLWSLLCIGRADNGLEANSDEQRCVLKKCGLLLSNADFDTGKNRIQTTLSTPDASQTVGYLVERLYD